MTCIKTGARVYFTEYGFVVPADLYRVGDAIVIRWVFAGRNFVSREDAGATHEVEIGISGFHREDLGVTVVRDRNIREVSP